MNITTISREIKNERDKKRECFKTYDVNSPMLKCITSVATL
jgi:hypothetical protein